jgi:dihydrofolate reductase
VKLVTHTFLTLDGVMQGPGGAWEDPSGGFGRGGWLVPFSDADMGVIVESWFARTEAILLGRNTFETMRAYWSQVTDPANGAAAKLNHGRKYVVSNTLTRADWGDTTVLRGDVVGQVADIRNGGMRIFNKHDVNSDPKPHILAMDPPQHTQLRRAVAPLFTPAAVAADTNRVLKVMRFMATSFFRF